jgi:uncharacterized membrane protein
MKNIKTMLITFFLILVFDGIYLFLQRNYYNKQIISVQNTAIKMNVLGAILCYILIWLGLYYFIIKDKRTISDAFLLGIFVYGVYELTNYSLFKNWNFKTVLMDTLWGGVLFALVTFFTQKLVR